MKKKEKKYGLLKGIILFLVVAFILTWLIPNGALSSGGFVDQGMKRLGLEDIATIVYYSFYYSLDKIVLLLAIGGLYGVLTKTKAYEKLVTGIAKKITWKKTFAVIMSVLIAGITSLVTQSFVVIIFIPFIISIMHQMKLDKLTILATTFGSVLVGTMGATYGTEGVMYFNQYIISSFPDIVKDTVLIRLGILAIGLVLFNFFTVMHMRKVEKEKEQKLETADMFLIDTKEDNTKTTIPIIVIGLLLFVISILGFVNWGDNFNITVFDTFHEKITTMTIGEDFFIFKDLLGSNMQALGRWEVLFPIASIIFVFTLILALCYRVKLDDLISNFANGCKKVIKPALCVCAAYMLLVIVYLSPFMATIFNKILTMTDGFNLATMSLTMFLTNVFHTDLGFTGYILAGFLVTEYVDYINPVYIILVSLYGFVQFFIPTSVILGVGITSLDVKYTSWLKHIWRFILGMLICLLVIFILMTVI